MSIRRSLAFSFLEKYASTVINLAATLVLARLLTPTEIGVFSVGAAVVGIMHTLRDFGITNYLIQEREVGYEKIRTAFTVTLALSWLFAAILFAISGWAAEFYREAGVREIVWVMAVNFVLIPLGSPILALMRREMQFGRLAGIQLTSTAVNAVTGIALAFLGHGFMSLAWASLAGVVVTSGLAFVSRPHAFLLRPGLHEWRSVFAFGSYASANALAGDLRLTSPDLIMGRLLGFEAVGLYSRATGLLAIFNKVILDALYPVLLPALAEKARQGDDLRETYLRSFEFLAVLYWPFLAFLAIMAEVVIRVLLGDQWLAAAPIAQILCIAYAIGTPGHLMQPLLMAIGRIRDMFILNLVLLPLTLMALVLGSFDSLETVASLIVVATAVSLVVLMRVLGRLFAVSVTDVLRASRRSTIVTALSSLVPLAAALWPELLPASPFATLLITGAASAVVWLCAVLATGHSIADEMQLVLGKARHALGRN